MAITTASGERYDSLENFIGDSPNEYVKMEFDALYGYTKPDKSKHPIEDDPAVSTDLSGFPKNPPTPSNAEYMKLIKENIERDRSLQDAMDILHLTPSERGKRVIPGEPDWTKTKDLGKPVVYAMEPFDINPLGKHGYLEGGGRVKV